MSFLYRLLTRTKQISPHIRKFEFELGVFVVSIWLVESSGRFYVIDTGMRGMEKYAVQYLLPQNIEAIFLTHGHSDHISGLPYLNQHFGELPTLISEKEFPYISGQKPFPNRKHSEKLIFDPSDFMTFESLEADRLLREAGLKVLFSPGHSPGHVSYYHKEDQLIIAGDLFTATRGGSLRPPMKQYTADMKQALTSGQAILQAYPEAVISVCHGSEVKHALQAFEAAAGFKELGS